MSTVVLTPDSAAEAQFLAPVQELAGSLLLSYRGYFGTAYLHALNQARAAFIVRGTASMNPLIVRAWGAEGGRLKCFEGKRLKAVAAELSKCRTVDMDVCYRVGREHFHCRLVAHPNPREDIPRYLVTNLGRDTFSVEQVADRYRLRWQAELLFKEWKSFANLHAFDISNPHLAEGLIWAALCAAVLKRYCAHMAQCLMQAAISTQKAASCLRHVLTDIIRAPVAS